MTRTIDIALPTPYPKQREAIWTPARTAVIEACTKAGKTVGCMLWLIDRASSNPNPYAVRWWVAPVYPVAEIAYRRMANLFRRAGIPESLFKCNDSDLSIRFRDWGWFRFKSAEKPDNLYGEDVADAVIDEASRVREESFHAIRSTLTATRGSLRVIGNVRGRRNWAYRLGASARSGAKDTAYSIITADDAMSAGVIRQEEVDIAREQLPHHVFRELYYCEPAEDGGNPFGLAAIQACIQPASTDPPAAWGVDLAKYHDWTVAIALDSAGHVCRFDRWQGPWNITEPRLSAMIGGTPALIDSSGVGDPIVERIQSKHPRAEGFKFTSQSKQALMEGLASAIHQGRVGYPPGPIVEELEMFEYVLGEQGRVRYSAPEGAHDDCVCALALAVQCLGNRPVSHFNLVSGGRLSMIGSEFADDDRLWVPMR